MLWTSHQLVTFMGVLAVTGNPVASLLSSMAAVFPDAVEIATGGFIKHRGISHWFPVYLVPCVIDAIYLHHADALWITQADIHSIFENGFTINLLIGNIFFWWFIGCLCHIVEDLLTGYIPIKNPSHRWKWKILFYPGSPKEYVFDILWVICAMTMIAVNQNVHVADWINQILYPIALLSN